VGGVFLSLALSLKLAQQHRNRATAATVAMRYLLFVSIMRGGQVRGRGRGGTSLLLELELQRNACRLNY